MQIDAINVAGSDGLIGLSSCPGAGAVAGAGRRKALEADAGKIKAWDARALVSALEYEELQGLDIVDLGVFASRTGLWWFRVPLREALAPDERFWRAWPNVAPSLLQLLRQGQRIVIHDAGSFGRAGLVACCLLQELGRESSEALRLVRAVQPAAVQGAAQELFIRQYLPRFPLNTRLKSS